MISTLTPELADKIYSHSLFSCVVGLLIIGICFCVRSRPRQDNPKYWMARKLLGIVSFTYAALCFVFLIFDVRANNADLATAISSSVFYFSVLVYEIAFLPILQPGINERKIIKWSAVTWISFFSLQIIALSLFPEYGRFITFTACVWFFIGSLRVSYKIFYTYYTVRKTTEEISIRDIHPEIRWIFYAAFAMVFGEFFCGLAPYINNAVIGISSFCGIFIYLYMYISFNRYIQVMPKIAPVLIEAEQIAEENRHGVEEGEEDIISKQSVSLLNNWLADKKFLEEDISLTDLANTIGTNRNYLSRYINRVYACSFRTFINHARIQEACEYLRNNPKANISEVSAHCGYNSVSYFSTVFKQETGFAFSKFNRKGNIQQ